MKLFMTKRRKERNLEKLKEAAALMKKALEHTNLDMAYVALITGTKAANRLGFKSFVEATDYYDI